VYRSIGGITLPKVDTGPFNFGFKASTDKFPARFQKWEVWLKALFPAYVKFDFGERHRHLWAWVDDLKLGHRPAPFVAIWPRGGAKSTTAELAVVRVGAKRTRKYVWYVSSSQAKADMHVSNIAAMLESSKLEHFHPSLANRLLGKFGAVKGWRRNRLRTASGLTVDALGLDVGARGSKIEESRPDFIILDDVDEKADSPAVTLKKIDTITATLLPAGSHDVAILFIQNVIHQDSIAARLVDGRADFMNDRIVSGPYKAVEDLVVENIGGRYIIKGGTATWAGQSIEICQSQILTWGISAFMSESQHEVDRQGSRWANVQFQHVAMSEVPKLQTVVCSMDPAITATKVSDCQGIQIDGIAANKNIYRLYSKEAVMAPREAIRLALKTAIQHGATHFIIETNQGGDLWEQEYHDIAREVKQSMADVGHNITLPIFEEKKQSKGKEERNEKMLADYETGRVIHVYGTHLILEKALLRFPSDPTDLCDAAFTSWERLRSAAAVFSFDYTTRKNR